MDCYDRIKDLCDKNGIAVTALETKLGFGRGSIGKMRTAKSVSADRVRKIADYFGVSAEYLITGEVKEGYYINQETAEMAQQIFENSKMRILFDAAKDADPEDLQMAADMLYRLKAKALGLDNDDGC